jgi:prolyl-tRNA editing enzyme YbaK/EbsC (Cys-tRNA(Pro) deacylase)
MDANHTGEIVTLSDTAKTAVEAAQALGIKVGQVASSIVFGLPGDPDPTPLLVITSGRHRVDAHLVADFLHVEKLLRADADFVRQWSGFAIGGVSPLAWLQPATIIIDEALNDYDVIWAAAGHPHAVFPTTFAELISLTGATSTALG